MKINLLRLCFFLVSLNLASNSFSAEIPSPQVLIVAKLYHDFAFEAVIDEPTFENSDFIDQPRNVLIRYFTPKLADLIIRDRQCVKATQEICRLNFVPLWGNQDPIGAGVKITTGTKADAVNVQLNYSSSTHQLIFLLAQTSSGWRIRDIVYGEFHTTLVKILESKP
jgi:hypothetical protein